MKQEPLERAIYLHQAGKIDKARGLYQKILKKNPNNVDALHFYGILNFQENKVERAIELIKRSIKNKPDYSDAHNNLGNIYTKLGRLEDARQCYEKSLQIAPGRIEAYNNLGILMQHLDDHTASLKPFKKALELKPDWADAHYNLANSYAFLGRESDAMHHYQNAIKLDPKFSIAMTGLGKYLYSLGRIEEVMNLYKDWLKLEPSNPMVEHMLAACSGENIPERASDDYIRKTFNDFANSFDSKLKSLKYNAPQLIANIIKSQIDDNKTLNILDAGCGTGLCGPLFKPFAKTLSGVDLSKNMLSLARERNCYDTLVCEELVSYINKFSNSFDIIVSADTLVYFGNLTEAFNAVSKALKAGGLFAFSVEKLNDENDDIGYKLEPHGRYAHNKTYIENLIEEAGLKLTSINEAVIRKELKTPVDGWIIISKKLA